MKQFSKKITCIVLCFVFLLANAQQTTTVPPGLDKYIDSVLHIFEVPGISVAVVKDGKIILAKGYGIKKSGEKNPVTEHTLFSIASNTKAFTAAALAILVEEKKLQWDDPVINYLPWFRMSDPWVTSQMTVRDLLVHHSGIPGYAGDVLIFPPSDYTRKEIVSKVKDFPLVHSFRTHYAYDNILYLAAGEVVKAVSGMEWEDFIQTRIFDKIGMNESVARFSSIKNHPDVSSAHSRIHGTVRTDEHYFEQAIGDAGNPAGGIASNAIDMCKWLITQLDSGLAASGNRIFNASATKELWKVVTPIPVGTAAAGLAPSQMDFFGYALGLRCYNYGKYKVVGHGGKLDGFVSQVAFVPKLKLGIAILTNQESTSAYWSVMYHLFDFYMQNKPFDWIKGFKAQTDSSLAASKREWQKANIVPDKKAMHVLPLEKYAGTYHDNLYGDIAIEKKDTGLVLTFKHTSELIADLVPFQYETFIAKFHNRDLKADAYATFTIGANGNVEQLKLKVIDPDCDLSFDDLLFTPTINH
jgi:CubicO group peptidase (beta-lactamase class C family)